MGTNITTDDPDLILWLDGKEAEQYWDRGEKDEKQILRSGWILAQNEYNRIKGLKTKSENDWKLKDNLQIVSKTMLCPECKEPMSEEGMC